MESRARTILALYTFALLGVLLVVAPWSRLWEQATGALLPPAWAKLLLSDWARGLVSGVGVLDLLFAGQALRELWLQVRAAATSRPGTRDPGRSS